MFWVGFETEFMGCSYCREKETAHLLKELKIRIWIIERAWEAYPLKNKRTSVLWNNLSNIILDI